MQKANFAMVFGFKSDIVAVLSVTFCFLSSPFFTFLASFFFLLLGIILVGKVFTKAFRIVCLTIVTLILMAMF